MNFDNISNIANTITDKSNLTSSVIRSIKSFTDYDDVTSNGIRDRYTNGFYNSDTSPFSPSVFSRMFDEPTYLTFRIKFNFDEQMFENRAGTYLNGDMTTLDSMPEPLLNLSGRDSHDYKYYSTYDYLRNNLGENLRANMLYRFVKSLEDIQKNYPYYFTGIEGLSSLSTVDPQRGIRLKDGNNILTIKCLEGLDLKITELMQLYRKIAWDDEYQRWILPDMMRFFSMDIYVSEIRLFHTYAKTSSFLKGRPGAYSWDSNFLNYTPGSSSKLSWLDKANNVLNSTIATSSRFLGFTDSYNDNNYLLGNIKTIQTARNNYKNSDKTHKLCDHVINDFMPTIKYTCNMCEFDISDTLSFINSLSSSKNGLNNVEPIIRIKVGKVKEEMIFPLQINSLTPSLFGYALKYSPKDTISNAQNTFISGYINDNELMKDSTHRYPGNLGVDEIVTEAMLLYNNLANKRNRVNDSYGQMTVDENYTPLTASSDTIKENIIQGGLYDASKDLFDALGVNGYMSSATYKFMPDRTNVYAYNKSILGFVLDIVDQNIKRKKLGKNVYIVAEILSRLLTMSEDEKRRLLPKNVYDTPENNKVLAKLAASENLFKLIKTIYGEITDSASPDPAFNFQLSENVFNGILDKISKSDATDPETVELRDLAKQILNYDTTSRSDATHASERRKKQIRDAFSYLNN